MSAGPNHWSYWARTEAQFLGDDTPRTVWRPNREVRRALGRIARAFRVPRRLVYGERGRPAFKANKHRYGR